MTRRSVGYPGIELMNPDGVLLLLALALSVVAGIALLVRYLRGKRSDARKGPLGDEDSPYNYPPSV